MWTDFYDVFDPAGTAITVSADSTNVLDMLNKRDMGIGDPDMKLAINVGTALAGGTSLAVQLMASQDNSTYYVLAESRPYLTAELTANKKLFPIDLPVADNIFEPQAPRYYKLHYVVVGTYTSGTLQANLVLDRRDHHYYPAGVTVPN